MIRHYMGYGDNVRSELLLTPNQTKKIANKKLNIIEVKNYDNYIYVFLTDDQNEKYKIKVKIDYLVKAIVPLRNIKANEFLNSDDLAIISLPDRQISYLDHFPEKNTYVAKVYLSKDKPIKNDDIGKPIAINKGKKITVVFTKHNLTIETAAISLESGSIDDTIKVKIIDSGKTLYGTVVNDEMIVVK